ncbi:MAG: hypothetical protein Ct9H300mP19_12300 [Dehalococcoidia bacterium]|nr:MAG: hypothetical protein Ct9H300mP19_12300 [Dehalococcoidia bacterium]
MLSPLSLFRTLFTDEQNQEDELFPKIRETGVGLMAYSPLGVGLLSGTYKHGEVPETAHCGGLGDRGRLRLI